MKSLAFSYNEWFEEHRHPDWLTNWHDMDILRSDLEELLLVVDYDETLESGEAEIVELDSRTPFTRKGIRSEQNRYAHGETDRRRECDNWQELVEEEVCLFYSYECGSATVGMVNAQCPVACGPSCDSEGQILLIL